MRVFIHQLFKLIKMKKALKLFLGDFLVYRIMDFKTKWFPNKEQKKRIKQELEEISKRKLFYGSFIKKNDLCFDVGTNVGNRIIPLLELGAKIVAVEPQESCYKILKHKFGKKIEIVTKGIGESEGVANFHISNVNTISSFSDEWINSVKNARFKDYSWAKVVKVEMTTLDKLIEKYSLPIFIKIDVEGYELDVLKGLTKPIKLISFEYTVPEQINKVIECIEQIEKNDANIECNYSIGESMVLALQVWQSVEKMKKYIITKEFIDSGFGDVYVRIKN
jgi:FkbM family methyltransferase